MRYVKLIANGVEALRFSVKQPALRIDIMHLSVFPTLVVSLSPVINTDTLPPLHFRS